MGDRAASQLTVPVWSSALVVEQAGTDGALERPDLVEDRLAVRRHPVGLEHDIADLAGRLVVLSGNVDSASGEHLVEAPEHARQIALHLDEAGAARPRRKLHLGEIHRTDGAAD